MFSRSREFSVDNGVRIERGDEKGREAIGPIYHAKRFQHGEDPLYIEKTSKVLYRSRMQKGKHKKNFVIDTAEEFITAITQHIPKRN